MHSRPIHPITFATLSLISAALIGGCGDDGGPNGDFCQDNCAAVLAANCTNGPADMADCIEGCGYAQTTCPSAFEALADCSGSGLSFACDDYDSPAPSKCADENIELQACLSGVAPYCYAVCPAVIAPGCSNGPSTASECLDGCQEAASNCPTEFDALIQCAGTDATFSCDLSDSPVPDGCEAENDSLNTCLE